MLRTNSLPVLFALFTFLAPALLFAQAHRFKAEKGFPTFSRRDPVLRIKPGDTVETNTLWGAWYERDGGAWPGEVGPFYIEGAEPGDTLSVEILKLAPNHDTAVSTQRPGFGALVTDKSTPLLNDPTPSRRYVWKLDLAKNTGTLALPGSRMKSVTVTLSPMLGRVAVAPAGEQAWDIMWPGDFGGNMDVPDICQGATVYLPVFHPGALFYFGDGHALQGDGEVCGSGLETAMDVTFRFDLVKGKRISWPRIEDRDFIMTTGSVRPLMDAFRIAHVEMVNWLVSDYAFDKWEALQLVSQLGTCRIGNVVDPNYTVVAKFPKKHLPH
jgi:amidase